MSIRVDLGEAKERFDELVSEAEAGESVVITREGAPVARLVRYEPRTGQRPGRGALKGKIHIPDDFDDLDEEIIRAFEESAERDWP
ncbi:MAG TPA: type II toxin-antitoxin system prevent-host-death family antitoxin [Candidatus Nanopelagicales bacterium]|nr:type II toxin-antitoxin system prevent-host-death family antitoxin [Candidatus Nanopelagicales bacterium]